MEETSNPVGRAKIGKAAYAAFSILVCSGVGLGPSAEGAQVRHYVRVNVVKVVYDLLTPNINDEWVVQLGLRPGLLEVNEFNEIFIQV